MQGVENGRKWMKFLKWIGILCIFMVEKEMRKNDGRAMLALAINIKVIKASARVNQPSEINENWCKDGRFMCVSSEKNNKEK